MNIIVLSVPFAELKTPADVSVERITCDTYEVTADTIEQLQQFSAVNAHQLTRGGVFKYENRAMLADELHKCKTYELMSDIISENAEQIGAVFGFHNANVLDERYREAFYSHARGVLREHQLDDLDVLHALNEVEALDV